MAVGRRGVWLILVLVVLAGVVVLGAYSSSPRFCASCHGAMGEHFDSWSGSSHAEVAGCVDCHIHPGWVGYIEGKFRGLRNAVGYWSGGGWQGGTPPPGRADCLRAGCHTEERLAATPGGPGVVHRQHVERLDCTDCHEDVGHVPAEESIARDCTDCHVSE